MPTFELQPTDADTCPSCGGPVERWDMEVIDGGLWSTVARPCGCALVESP